VTLGPVQLIVLGFHRNGFRRQLRAELQLLGANEGIRVIDALAVYKDGGGELEVEELADGVPGGSGRTIGALVGLTVEGEEEQAAPAEQRGLLEDDAFPEDDAWDVLAEIPNDSGAALILVEHRWAAPLQDAMLSSGGYRIGDGFISPIDLAAIGLITLDEASEQQQLQAAAASR
jgi:hypothetical protein